MRSVNTCRIAARRSSRKRARVAPVHAAADAGASYGDGRSPAPSLIAAGLLSLLAPGVLTSHPLPALGRRGGARPVVAGPKKRGKRSLSRGPC
eukprot:scaffold1224_cov392-Prasinococcus_capsulatus_cf.AAC.4